MKMPTMPRLEPSNGYPETVPEEERMPTSDWHVFLLGLILQMLRWHYRDEERVAVHGDLLVHYVPGNLRQHVSPDVFVVRNAEKRWRRNWLAWADGLPEFVIELLSESTVANDLGAKRELYRNTLRVREYFVFDTEGGLVEPRLQGWRLIEGAYVTIEPVEGRLPSEVTGLHLEQAGDYLRFWNPATRAWVPFDAERAEQEATRADDEAALREAETARANDEAARANLEAALRADEEQARRAATARADHEKSRADAAEERLRRAESELERLRAALPPDSEHE